MSGKDSYLHLDPMNCCTVIWILDFSCKHRNLEQSNTCFVRRVLFTSVIVYNVFLYVVFLDQFWLIEQFKGVNGNNFHIMFAGNQNGLFNISGDCCVIIRIYWHFLKSLLSYFIPINRKRRRRLGQNNLHNFMLKSSHRSTFLLWLSMLRCVVQVLCVKIRTNHVTNNVIYDSVKSLIVLCVIPELCWSNFENVTLVNVLLN